MNLAGQALRVAVYCRISSDREGEQLGVERQRDDCLARARREGWRVVDIFTDNDISASTKSRKPRPAYKRMIKRAQAGDFDVILSYSNSRLTRRPLELEDLIALHAATGVLLRTVVSGDADLATADGRAVARTLAAWDAAEAERISERVTRAARQRREDGKRHGGFPPFGYENAAGGTLAIHHERADVIREAARRVLAGETLYGIYTDLNRRGVRTGPSPKAKNGAAWHARTLKRVLTTPATVGCIETDTGELRPVADPILDREDWNRLRELLFEPTRYTETSKRDWSNRRKFALSGLLHCDLCGHYMTGSSRAPSKTKSGETRPRVKTFMCNPANGGCGKIRIDYAAVEAWVLSLIFARLDVAGVRDALSRPQPVGDDRELRRKIDDDERGLEKLDDAFADGLLDRDRYQRQVSRITDRLDALRAELAAHQRAALTIDTGGKTLREAWDDRAGDVPWRRELLGHLIERVAIRPHPAGVTSTLTRRRGEDDEQLERRRSEHLERILFERVRVSWLT